MLVETLAPCEFSFIAPRYEIRVVRTIEDIRHARLLQLLAEPRFRTIQDLANLLEKSHAQVSQWKNRSYRRNKQGEVVGQSNIDSISARTIEERTGKERGWMDNDPFFDAMQKAVQINGPRKEGAEPDRPDFNAKVVSDSQYQLLQDVIDGMTEEQIQHARERAEKNRAHFQKIFEGRLKPSTDGEKR